MSKKYFQYHEIVGQFLGRSASIQFDVSSPNMAEDRIKAAFIKVLEEENLREEIANFKQDCEY